ncbi:hypothetical protein HK101_001399 [Irineochytrium annulatum]|nr:hypothetical protein HK101_001399 [Irineochytrium annulatum]
MPLQQRYRRPHIGTPVVHPSPPADAPKKPANTEKGDFDDLMDPFEAVDPVEPAGDADGDDNPDNLEDWFNNLIDDVPASDEDDDTEQATDDDDWLPNVGEKDEDHAGLPVDKKKLLDAVTASGSGVPTTVSVKPTATLDSISTPFAGGTSATYTSGWIGVAAALAVLILVIGGALFCFRLRARHLAKMKQRSWFGVGLKPKSTMEQVKGVFSSSKGGPKNSRMSVDERVYRELDEEEEGTLFDIEVDHAVDLDDNDEM